MRMIAEKSIEAREDMAAQMNRRIMNCLKEEGGGRRRIQVGE